MSRLGLVFLLIVFGFFQANAHEIPNARVDRSIQVTVHPGRLTIDYEVSLSELTLLQDLRALSEPATNTDARALFEQYGRISGPLNAKGFLVSAEGVPRELRMVAYELNVEEHPRITFHFETDLPPRGRISIKDTNYESSEGTSRLALRGVGGVRIRGDDLPIDVALIPIRPVWQLTDAEERRTRQVVASYEPSAIAAVAATVPSVTPRRPTDRLSHLLDRSGASVFGLWLIALTMGAAHALQPGHGKSLVAAASLGDRSGWYRGPALALTITLAHFGGVLALALALWATRTSRYPEINRGLTQAAGFVIAAIGFWRLGRHLGGHGEHVGADLSTAPPSLDARGLLALGLAGGAVPCWDAVILILLAEAIGRLALGLALLSAFSLGMAVVLVAVGLAAARLRGYIQRRDAEGIWARRVGLLSAAAVAAIGIYLLSS